MQIRCRNGSAELGVLLMIRVVDYIVKRIKEQDVNHIFFVSGAGCMFLTDALAKDTEITHVSMHHEQAASMAALAYAQQKNELGCCFVTTGCGGTNTITSVLHAWQDGIPMLIVAGQVKWGESVKASGEAVRQYGRQEADVVSMISSITKYAETVKKPEDIGVVMDRAIYEAMHGRKGPVWVAVPLDIQAGVIDEESLKHAEYDDSGRLVEGNDSSDQNDTKNDCFGSGCKLTKDVSDEDMALVTDLLSNAKRPVIFIGSGIRLSGAVDVLNEFEKKTHIPLVYARTAADVMPADEPYVIGMTGTVGINRAANFAVANSDVLLVIGHRMCIETVGDASKYAREATICMVDIDPAEMNKSTIRVDHRINADAKAFLERLNETDIAGDWEEWKAKCVHWKEIFPRKDLMCVNDKEIDLFTFLDEMNKVLPENATLLSDAGSVGQMVPSVIQFDGRTQRSINPFSQGEMGFAIPGGVGAAFANPSGITFIMTGDGSAMMNIQELATIRYRELPTKIFVFNNGGYASIRKPQKESFRRTIGTDEENGVGLPSYERIAYGFDLPYLKIERRENLSDQILRVIKTDGPVLCEVILEKESKMIYTSMAMTKERRMTVRPIEDIAPFIDRDLFLKEMVIEPIDQ